jgi:hypothetical protein
MRRPPGVLTFAVLVSGLSLFLSVSRAQGQDQPIPCEDEPTLSAPAPPLSGCPPLPEQAPEGTVAVYVGTMLHKPGFVCVRMVTVCVPPSATPGFTYRGAWKDSSRTLPNRCRRRLPA